MNDQTTQPSPYAALGRPSAQWVCVLGMLYEFFIRPVLPWVVTVLTGHPTPPMPSLEGGEWAAMAGSLGIGALRSYDKLHGTDLRVPRG